jgi:hypothetical protein
MNVIALVIKVILALAFLPAVGYLIYMQDDYFSVQSICFYVIGLNLCLVLDQNRKAIESLKNQKSNKHI